MLLMLTFYKTSQQYIRKLTWFVHVKALLIHMPKGNQALGYSAFKRHIFTWCHTPYLMERIITGTVSGL